jgi:hypothetical protein
MVEEAQNDVPSRSSHLNPRGDETMGLLGNLETDDDDNSQDASDTDVFRTPPSTITVPRIAASHPGGLHTEESDGIFRFEIDDEDVALSESRLAQGQLSQLGSSLNLLDTSAHASWADMAEHHDELSELELSVAHTLNATVDKSAAIDTSRLGTLHSSYRHLPWS